MNNPNKEKKRRTFPFVVEFIKFTVVFVVIVVAALLTLHIASASL